jgi:AAA domain
MNDATDMVHLPDYLASIDAEIEASGGADAVVESRLSREPRAPRALDLRRLSDERAPAQTWFREGWLHAGSTLLPGKGGEGKSTLVQHEATCGALGRPYFAPECAPYRSLVWNCEDDHDDMWRRQERICEHERLDMADLADHLHLVSRYGCENALMAEVQRTLVSTSLFEELRQQVNDLKIDVLWLDNVAHMFLGNHDDRTQVTQFINLLNGIVRGREFGVVLVAHVSRALGSEFSGSVAWENAARMRWFLGAKLPDEQRADGDDAPNPETRFLAKRKSNYSARDIVRMTMRNGLLVPDEAPGHIGGLVAQMDERKAEEIVLAAFHSLRGMGLVPTDSKNSPDYLPRQALDKGLGCGYGKNEMAKAMNRLMSSGVFSRGVAGHYGNRSAKQGLVLQSTGAE